jgi:hypothetical protein
MEGELRLCELKNLSSISALMHTPDYVWGDRYYDLLLRAGWIRVLYVFVCVSSRRKTTRSSKTRLNKCILAIKYNKDMSTYASTYSIKDTHTGTYKLQWK